jgi:ketosteroid isomerase-like protein
VTEPAPELCALLERYYAASAQGDADFLAEYIARDPEALVIGTDLSEWWRGGDETIAVWGKAWRTRGGLPVVASNPSAFKSGEIGWLSDQARWVLPDGREIPFRLSAVYRREEAGWKLIQAHYSLGVPNERFADFVG